MPVRLTKAPENAGADPRTMKMMKWFKKPCDSDVSQFPSSSGPSDAPTGTDGCRVNRWTKNAAQRREDYCYNALAFSRHSINLALPDHSPEFGRSMSWLWAASRALIMGVQDLDSAGDDFWVCHRIPRLLGSTADTCTCVSLQRYLENPDFSL